MPETVVFRVDASRRIGSGHVFRCLALAEAFARRGIECSFIHRQHDGHMRAVIERRGFRVHMLKSPPLVPDDIGDEDYAGWLGVTEDSDAEESIRVLEHRDAGTLVLDHYGLGLKWEDRLRDHVKKLVVIDDLPDRDHQCDVLITQGVLADTEPNSTWSREMSVEQVSGPEFALVASEYARARSLAVGRRTVDRILVFFGGNDRFGLTARTLALLSQEAFSHISVDVAVGLQSGNGADLARLAADRGRTTVHDLQASLAPLMLRADLMIGAAGMTGWERCAVGLPGLVAVIAENQRLGAHELARRGAVRLIDPRTTTPETVAGFSERLERELSDLVSSPESLQQMSATAATVTDGLGAQRVAELLFPSSAGAARLRTAALQDGPLLFRWVNEAGVRKASFQQDLVDWEEHFTWYETSLRRPDSRIWILETHDGVPIGQFRVDVSDGLGVVDYSIDAAFRGRGLGQRLLELGMKRWQGEFPDVPLRAETRPGNVRSQRTLGAAGWSLDESGFWRGGECPS